jgi:hypothetical protein
MWPLRRADDLGDRQERRYRYYKCTTRMSKGNRFCTSRNLPAEWLDELVLAQFEGRVLTTAELSSILREARRSLRERTATDRQTLIRLQNQLRKDDERLNRLYDIVETGQLPLDETLQRRSSRRRRIESQG